MDNTTSGSLVRKLPMAGSKENTMYVVGAVAVVLVGVFSGWVLSGANSGSSSSGTSTPSVPGVTSDQKEAGVADESTFKDTAEGILEKGDLVGDGTHNLVRPGGPDKQVALASTVIDLDSFVGKKVQVWGQTLTAQKAPWLMDVGKLKVIE